MYKICAETAMLYKVSGNVSLTTLTIVPHGTTWDPLEPTDKNDQCTDTAWPPLISKSKVRNATKPETFEH